MVVAYGNYTANSSNRTNLTSVQFIGSQLRKAERELLESKRNLKEYKERYKIFDIEQQLLASTDRIATLEKATAEAVAEASAGTASTTLQRDPIASILQKNADDARMAYEEASREFTPSSLKCVVPLLLTTRHRARPASVCQQYCRR
jgi:capsule polysaccharide export protein KpsE/RkpR